MGYRVFLSSGKGIVLISQGLLIVNSDDTSQPIAVSNDELSFLKHGSL